MGMFDDSGMITRGFGKDERIVTRGMGITFEVGGGGVIPTWRHKEYLLDIFASVLKQDSKIIDISSSVNFTSNKTLSLFSKIKKETNYDVRIKSYIDSKNLINILEEL